MMAMDDKEQIQADKEIIQNLGGPTKVAELLGYDKTSGGVQRVQNWMTRGIPPKVKLDHPDLFLRGFPHTTHPSPQDSSPAEEESNEELRREADLGYRQPADPHQVDQ